MFAYRLLNDEEAAFQREITQALTQLQGTVDSLVAAPLHEGLNRLRLASTASDGRRAQLLEEARAKFGDAAARQGAPFELRANASALAALCWAALEEPTLAATELEQAKQHADQALAEMNALVHGGYGYEADPLWRHLDDVERLVLQIERLGELLQGGGPELALDRPLVSPAHALVAVEERGRPAPSPANCEFLGGYGPEKLGSLWHRLRLDLAEDEEVRWFSEATDLRLLATSRTLLIYHPDHLRVFGQVKAQWPLADISVKQEGREWFDSFVVLTCERRAGSLRINLGPEGHARTVVRRLRQSMQESSA